MTGDEPQAVSRAEFEALRRRLAAVEETLRARGIAPPAFPAPRAEHAPVPEDAHAAAPTATPPRFDRVQAPGPAPASAPAARTGWTPPPTQARPPPPPRLAPAAPVSLESLLGQQWAPRVGAILVFLAVLFFLGVAIQRGWVGPLLQLGIAVMAGAALLGAGAWLTARKGYGTYPQVLEATGALVLYLTAFLSHALPYYQRETRLSEVGGGILMALVAAGTVALALYRDARVIAGLGYALGFATAALGVGLLPVLTLPYVALLGASLAFLVARKGWVLEAAAGTVATGGFLVALMAKGGTPPALLALVALVPAGAFLALSLRRVRPATRDEGAPLLLGLIVVVTYAWGVVTSYAPFVGELDALGLVMLAATGVAMALALAAARLGAERAAVTAHGASAVLLYMVGIPLLWWEADHALLLVTGSYALAALGLLLGARALPAAARGLSGAALALLTLSVLVSFLAHGAEAVPWEARDGLVSGSWQAWATLVLVAPGFALLVLAPPRGADATMTQMGFALAVLFLALWGFVLFPAPFLATLWLLGLAAAAFGVALARERPRELLVVAALLLGVAVLKGTLLDFHSEDVRLPPLLGALQATLLAAALLAAHHLLRDRRVLAAEDERTWSALLVGGSAAVLADAILAYLEGPAVSIGLGALGVAYLTAGLVLRSLAVHRYAGFALLGFVLLRVFLVDLRETDLAVRALVFAVLGGILLGVGYVYARQARKVEPPAAPPMPPAAPPAPPAGPGERP